jgi:hypothetical protein
MARPTDFKEEFVDEAAQLSSEGATDQEMADYFGVDVRTLYRWKNTQPEFRQAIKSAKDAADDRVERSLFERALGYERDEVDVRVVAGVIVQTKIRKFYPPDTTAAIFWLKNRKPTEWREKNETTLTGPAGGPIESHLTIEFVDGPGKSAE